jgi:CheY-like chemotaxis protein
MSAEKDETYITRCHGCQQGFDALQARWCACPVNETTLVCPSCSRCFCAAPPAYKGSFWTNAPPSLWERKFDEHHRRSLTVPRPEPHQATRPLVLVVEDDPVIQRMVGRVIASLGYGMVLAHNGADGLELVRRYKPELVLSDALMPQMDGREMCRLIKEDPATADVRVVVMTALYTGVKYRDEAHNTFRVDDYVTKPLVFDRLRSLLQRHLEARPAARREERA